jgi:hypothetical protein
MSPARIALLLSALLWCVLLASQWAAGPRDGVVTEYARHTDYILGIGPVIAGRGEWAGVRLAILLVLAPAGLCGAALLRGTGRWFSIATLSALALLSFLEMPQLSNDVFLYRAAGQMVAEGNNPYLVAPSASFATEELQGIPWKSQRSPYGPLALHMFALASVLGGGWLGSLWVLRVMMALPWVLTLLVLARSDGDRAPPLLFLAASPLLLLEIVQGGHVDGWIGFLLVVVCAIAARDRMTYPGRVLLVVAFTAAIALKISSVVVAGALFVHLVRRPRWGWYLATRAAVGVAILYALIWWPLWGGFESLEGLRAESSKVLQSVFQIAGVSGDSASFIAAAGSIFALVVGAVLAARGWSLAISCMVALILQAILGRTFLQPWYFAPVIMIGGWAILEQAPGCRFARALADPAVWGVASTGLLAGGYGLVFATRSIDPSVQTANVLLMIVPGTIAWIIRARRLS